MKITVKRFIKSGAALISSKRASRINSPGNVLLLMYHRVNDIRGNELITPTREFRKQLAWLRENGYVNLRMSELERAPHESAGERARVIFTFDDGYEDNYSEAFPLLKEFGYTGLFYVAVNNIGANRSGDDRMMNWAQLEEMSKCGMEIGSHTMSHVPLTGISPEEARKEIFDSKKVLEDKLQSRITSFCYPLGIYKNLHAMMVREAGYLSACTAFPGIRRNHDMYKIPRIAVLASDGFFTFKQKAMGKMDWLRIIH